MGGRILGVGGIWTRDIIDYRLASLRVICTVQSVNIPAIRLLSACPPHLRLDLR